MKNDSFESLAQDNDLVLILDDAGKCVSAGPAPLVTGLFVSLDVVGKAIVELIAEDYRSSFADALQLAQSGEATELRLELREPARSLLLKFSRADSGVIILGNAPEVADPMRRASQESNEELRSVLRHLQQGVLLQGPQAEILMSNQAALDLLGLSEAQLLGSSSFDPRWRVVRADGSDFPGPEHPVPTAIATKKPVRDVLMGVFRPSSEDWVWLSVDAIPELFEDGSVKHVVCTFTDVTTQREAEERRRKEHALHSQVMETSLTGICVLDTEGQILFANNAAEDILGLSRAEITQRSYDAPQWRSTDLEGNPWPDEKQPFVRVMTTRGPVRNVRHAIEWPNGQRKVLSINGAPIMNEQGEIERCVFAILDITEDTQTAQEREKLLAEMEKLSQLESMSVLAAGVAHDFNNILVGVQSAGDMISRHIQGDHPCAEDAELLKDSVARAAELTAQLLAYSGKGRFVVGLADLSTVVRETTQLLESMTHRDAVLEFELKDGLPLPEIDRTQVRQILMNLALNASEALDGRPGTIRVSTGEVEVTEEKRPEGAEPGPYVFIEVNDNGMGMDESVLTRVFDPFFTTKETGHGLGLAAVQGVMRGHGGFVQAESTLGEGTRFCLGFPVAAPAATAPDAEAATSSATARMSGRLLIVDDEQVVVRSLKRMLSDQSLSIVTAHNGIEALEMLKQSEEFSAVLLDLTMPKMRGEAVLEEIRKSHSQLPVLLMSGYSEDAVSNCEPPTYFMAKPFTREQVLQNLRTLLD